MGLKWTVSLSGQRSKVRGQVSLTKSLPVYSGSPVTLSLDSEPNSTTPSSEERGSTRMFILRKPKVCMSVSNLSASSLGWTSPSGYSLLH